MEGLSDGVLAIVMTIMVLEMRAPEGASLAALSAVTPTFLAYVLSFFYIGVHWNNHHHLLAACHVLDGTIMWANLHLLFWLSLIPFTTRWLGGTGFAEPMPAALYGVVLLMSGLAYWALQARILAATPRGSALHEELGTDRKGLASLALYGSAIGIAFLAPVAAALLYAGIALIWIVPDKRIERAHARDAGGPHAPSPAEAPE